jgi:hypothetical protein
MADATLSRAQLLRREFHRQTARIHWHALQSYYAHGSVVCVEPDLDLVEVAVQLGLDDVERFQQWIAERRIAPVSEAQALAWYEGNRELWAVVAAPWVLVQDRVVAVGEASGSP